MTNGFTSRFQRLKTGWEPADQLTVYTRITCQVNWSGARSTRSLVTCIGVQERTPSNADDVEVTDTST